MLIDGKAVTFQDVPSAKLREIDVEITGHGTAHITVIDTLKADKTTRQHGVAWRVDARLVGISDTTWASVRRFWRKSTYSMRTLYYANFQFN